MYVYRKSYFLIGYSLNCDDCHVSQLDIMRFPSIMVGSNESDECYTVIFDGPGNLVVNCKHISDCVQTCLVSCLSLLFGKLSINCPEHPLYSKLSVAALLGPNSTCCEQILFSFSLAFIYCRLSIQDPNFIFSSFLIQTKPTTDSYTVFPLVKPFLLVAITLFDANKIHMLIFCCMEVLSFVLNLHCMFPPLQEKHIFSAVSPFFVCA